MHARSLTSARSILLFVQVPIPALPQKPSVDLSTVPPALHDAIFRVTGTASGAEWGARIAYENKVHKLGRFQGKKEAAEAFRTAMQKYYGQDGVQKYCRGLEYFIASPYDNTLNAVDPMGEMSDDSDDEGYEDPSSGLDKSAWLLMGETVK